MKEKNKINYTELYNWLWKMYHEERKKIEKIKPNTIEEEDEKFAHLVTSNAYINVIEKINDMINTEY